jgi:Choline/Carnitine o-acyltransferase
VIPGSALVGWLSLCGHCRSRYQATFRVLSRPALWFEHRFHIVCRLLQFPWFDGIPLGVRLALLAAYTSLAVAVLFATIQRVLIRLLLRYKGFLYNARKPTLATKLWAVSMKLLVGKRKHRLYSFQGVLPSLPVPKLSETCKRYLESVEPLQSPEQFQKTKVLPHCLAVRVSPAW